MTDITNVRTIVSAITAVHPTDLTPEQRKHLGLEDDE